MHENHRGSVTYQLLGVQESVEDGCCSLHWEDCDQQIDLAALSSREPILFYDEVGYFILIISPKKLLCLLLLFIYYANLSALLGDFV